jgi:hypothetical protein
MLALGDQPFEIQFYDPATLSFGTITNAPNNTMIGYDQKSLVIYPIGNKPTGSTGNVVSYSVTVNGEIVEVPIYVKTQYEIENDTINGATDYYPEKMFEEDNTNPKMAENNAVTQVMNKGVVDKKIALAEQFHPDWGSYCSSQLIGIAIQTVLNEKKKGFQGTIEISQDIVEDPQGENDYYYTFPVDPWAVSSMVGFAKYLGTESADTSYKGNEVFAFDADQKPSNTFSDKVFPGQDLKKLRWLIGGSDTYDSNFSNIQYEYTKANALAPVDFETIRVLDGTKSSTASAILDKPQTVKTTIPSTLVYGFHFVVPKEVPTPRKITETSNLKLKHGAKKTSFNEATYVAFGRTLIFRKSDLDPINFDEIQGIPETVECIFEKQKPQKDAEEDGYILPDQESIALEDPQIAEILNNTLKNVNTVWIKLQ